METLDEAMRSVETLSEVTLDTMIISATVATTTTATSAVVTGTRAARTMMCAEVTRQVKMGGFIDARFVQSDAEAEKMIEIDDDRWWEEHEEKKPVKLVTKKLLDGQPLPMFGEVLFTRDVCARTDGKDTPSGLSLLELV